MSATFRAGVHPLEPGWFDLAAQVPLLDTTRARTVLGWRPTHDSLSALAEGLDGIERSAATASPVLRRRSTPDVGVSVRSLTGAARGGGPRRAPARSVKNSWANRTKKQGKESPDAQPSIHFINN